LHNPNFGIVENAGGQIYQVDLSAIQTTQNSSHFLQQTRIPARFQGNISKLQESDGSIPNVFFSPFALNHLE
jgi:hypothetical protein